MDNLDKQLLGSYAYNPRYLNISVEGEKISGFQPGKKIVLAGNAKIKNMSLFLQVTSPSVPFLRKFLGRRVFVEINYKSVGNDFDYGGSVNDSFVVELESYEVVVTNETPTVVFSLSNSNIIMAQQKDGSRVRLVNGENS